jgi:hypothetical protein
MHERHGDKCFLTIYGRKISNTCKGLHTSIYQGSNSIVETGVTDCDLDAQLQTANKVAKGSGWKEGQVDHMNVASPINS